MQFKHQKTELLGLPCNSSIKKLFALDCALNLIGDEFRASLAIQIKMLLQTFY